MKFEAGRDVANGRKPGLVSRKIKTRELGKIQEIGTYQRQMRTL